MRVRVLVGAALVVVVIGVAAALSESKQRLAGSNNVPPSHFVVTVPRGGEACQPGEFVPADSRELRLMVGTYHRPVPRLEVELRAPGAPAVHGVLPAGRTEGWVEIPLERTTGAAPGATLCLRNGGAHRIVVAGTHTGPFARVGRRRSAGRMRIEYLRPGRESWWALVPTIEHRFGLGKAGFVGGWTLAAVALVLLAAWIGAIWLVVRPRTP
jgi:hypothetical protein